MLFNLQNKFTIIDIDSIVFFSDCKYTCHWRCIEEIDLDCIGSWPQHIARNMSIDEIAMKTLHQLDQVSFILLNIYEMTEL